MVEKDEDRDREVNNKSSDSEQREREFEAEQVRGRKRMIALWRAAVQAVTEAAAAEAERRKEEEGITVEGDEPKSDAPVATWVFPPKKFVGKD